MIGTEVDRVAFEVEPGKIREFARATGATDPVHTDAAAAHAAGWPGQLATATHVVVAGHYRDQAGFMARLGLALERVVAGSVTWSYRRPLHAGDHLAGVRRVAADDQRRDRHGRTMRLVTLETEYTDEADEVVLVQREVLIERPAPESS